MTKEELLKLRFNISTTTIGKFSDAEPFIDAFIDSFNEIYACNIEDADEDDVIDELKKYMLDLSEELSYAAYIESEVDIYEC